MRPDLLCTGISMPTIPPSPPLLIVSYYIKQIKKNVWKWRNENGVFSVKKYPSEQQAEKIRFIHDKLQYIEDPFVLPVVESPQLDFIIQPWFQGTHTVNYSNEEDRKAVYSLLTRLHETKKIIDWEDSKVLYAFNLISKWQNRLLKMKEISFFVESLIGVNNTKILLMYGDMALKDMKPFDMRDRTLLHGDVVHHNFLSDGSAYKIIDFDLAVIGPKEMESILWMHRVLSEIDYDIHFLMNEFPMLEKIVRQHKEAMMYPNELYREWLYAFALPVERKQKFIEQLVPYTNKALTEWPNLCYNLSKL
ncbi:aminoglycoside phosphotransferase family protein [Psychrobacillus sp. NEAU-3TGS]|uniref:aminoglycoside phosphotransferase family protein n=1 Tax=Psychrobacillus sp. NEAU-3TGS TaxID=2995412 RepID=UPI002498D6B6|nr:aminoglycoside phosphotransferase family protein [Psychrobacillus sp. NEAU-3TGS]MDI2588228.1 aminoglycoside phosphotransferase family protein [Psychrobacillus sp. NEAU-3TGS]